MGERRRITLMDMPIDAITERDAVAHILAELQSGVGGWVITPNLDQLRQFVKKPEVQRYYAEASLVLADGMPLVWAGWILGRRLPERVPGSAMIWSLTAGAAREGRSIFLLGGNEGSAAAAAEELLAKHPDLKVAGTYCPPVGFEKDAGQMELIRERLREVRPDIVYVGLGFPKQEKVIEEVRGELPGAWFLGIGVSFSFVSGEIGRAPAWMQRLGMEWMHRLVQEPKRLFKRYVVQGLPFAAQLFWYAVLRRVRGESTGRRS